MKKATVTLALAIAVLFTAAGCSHLGGGPSDEELVNQALLKWIEAGKAKDLDGMEALTSDNFKHDGYDYQAEGKEELRAFMQQGMDMGNFDGVDVVYDPDSITIEGDMAKVPNIEWNCAPGTAIIDLTFKKENGAWLIVDAAVEEL